MPRIDPQQLLKTLGILLSPDGGIKSSDEVDRLVKLMSKFSRKLVSKCIYVQILKATPSPLLANFLMEGGWMLLNTWFDDAIRAQNWPLVKEMLELFQACPMTASLLKENANEHQAPKLINQIRQEPAVRADIRYLALDIYKSWVNIVSSANSIIVTDVSQQAHPENNGPVSMLEALADEVSESLKKKNDNIMEEEEEEDDDDDDDDDFILSLKNRKVHTVQKAKGMIDGTIKINKENLPSPPKSVKSDSKSSKKDEDSKDKEREKRKRSYKDKDSSKDKESKDSSKDSEKESRREKERERSKRFRPDYRDEVNPDEKQRIKEMARKMKEEAQAKKSEKAASTTSLMSRIPKIPKKTSTSSLSTSQKGDDKKSNGKTFEEMLGGLDSKPKTVKTPMVKNKTAALLEGMKNSSSSSSSKSSSSSSKSSSSSSHRRDHHSSSSSSHHSSSRRDHHHSSSSSRKDSKSSSSSSSSGKKLSLTLPSTPETNKNKKDESSPKPSKSPQAFSESASFVDSIFNPMAVNIRKKKRRLSETKNEPSPKGTPPKISKKEDSIEKKESKEEPIKEEVEKEQQQPTFSFYKDTLEETPKPEEPSKENIKPEIKEENTKMDENVPDEDNKDNENDTKSNDNDTEQNQSSIDETTNDEPKKSDEMLPFEEPDSMPREVKGILVYHRGRGKRDKKITWKPESSLVEVEYFEVDENERVNVNKLKFENLREFESKMEKAALNSKSNMSDEEIPLLQWYRPLKIDIENREPFDYGANSKEKDNQADREKSVLQVIYFNRAMTPDTPGEADPDQINSVKSQHAIIPTEDAEGDQDSDFQYASKGWPEPKQNQVSQQASLESQFSLPPALSTLLSSIHKGGLEAIIPPVANLSKEEQDTLAAQTEAMKKLGILPNGTPVNSMEQTQINDHPPMMNPHSPPPPHGEFQRFGPPPPNGAFTGPPPPPFGGNPGPRHNGYFQQPPPFGGYQEHRNGDRGNRGFRGNHGNHGNHGNRGGYRHNGPQRGGGYHREHR